MEFEFENRKFFINDFIDRGQMNNEINQYIQELKRKYPTAIVTKEFYKGNGIIVRATQINTTRKTSINKIRQEKEQVRIKEKGIHGISENVYKEKERRHAREYERERGER